MLYKVDNSSLPPRVVRPFVHSSTMLTFVVRVLNQIFLGAVRPTKFHHIRPGAIAFDVRFRLWPIDMDAFMHMNNASYIRIAELARWRILLDSGLHKKQFRNMLHLVVDHDVKYFYPIMPFQSYVVRTTLSSSEGKWLKYKHEFLSAKKGPTGEERVYCVVDSTCVLKKKGKTIRIDEMADVNPFYKNLLQDAPSSA